jgi:essential nuclear protein 1
MPKATSTKKQQQPRHAPFVAQLAEEDLVQKFGRVSKPGKRAKKGDDDDDEAAEQTVRTSSA